MSRETFAEFGYPNPGGERGLGIQAVRDRVVQQALLDILRPIFDPDFHPACYGHRPGRSCQMAVAKATLCIRQYRWNWVVDIRDKKVDALKDKVKAITRRSSPVNLEQVIADLNPVLRGFAIYFRMANCKELFKDLATRPASVHPRKLCLPCRRRLAV